MTVQVKFSDVIDGAGTFIVTTRALTDGDLGWRVGDHVEIPLSSGQTTVARISGMRYLSGAGASPEQTKLCLEFAGSVLKDVKQGGELVNLGAST